MHETAILTGKCVFGIRCFGDGLVASPVLLSYEAERAIKHLSCCSELGDLLGGFPTWVLVHARWVSPQMDVKGLTA